MKKKISRFTGRRSARFFAVQALYQSEHSDHPLPKMLAQFVHQHFRDVDHPTAIHGDEGLFHTLIEGTLTHKDAIDACIASILSEGWALKRLDEVVLAVLRLAAFEALYALDTPVPVIVNEYIEVAKAFFSATEVNFIHVAVDLLGKKRVGSPLPL